MKKSLLLVGLSSLFLSIHSIAQTTSTQHTLPKAVTEVTTLNAQAKLVAEKQAQLDQSMASSRTVISEIKTELQNLLTTYQSMLKAECSKENTYEAQRELIDELMFTEQRLKELTTSQR